MSLVADIPFRRLLLLAPLLLAGCADSPDERAELSRQIALQEIWNTDYSYCHDVARKAFPDPAGSSYEAAVYGAKGIYRDRGNRVQRLPEGAEPKTLAELRRGIADECMRERGWVDAGPEGWRKPE